MGIVFPSAFSFIVLVFTFFHLGLHGHLQVCRIFIFVCLKDSASLLFGFAAIFFTWSPSACFPFVFFLCCFPSLFLLYPCVCVCLLAHSLLFACSVLPYPMKIYIFFISCKFTIYSTN
jgi:hypothetical protein